MIMPASVPNSFYPVAPSNEGSDTESSHRTQGTQSRQGSRGTGKLTGACVHCKSLKVRCEFSPGDSACQRCQAGNYQCMARTRKKRKPAPTHEDLQERSLNQDLQIKSLLLEFDKIKTETKIREWMAKAHSDTSSETSDPNQWRVYEHTGIEHPRYMSHNVSAVDMAITTFFPQGGGLHALSPPNIVKHCGLYPPEIVELFRIFFDRINPFFSILDPDLHTPERLIWTSPFLFTVVCATASRYYTERPNLYHLAKDFARDAAGKALIDASKSVDVCQAYLLLAVYPVPKKRWAEDRSWLLMGVAIRMALELQLNQPPPPHLDDREALNRTRTWLNCFCVDGSHAIQFGKQPMLRLDDYTAKHSEDWYKTSPINIDFDIHLCGYVELIILMAEWRNEIAEEDLRLKRGESFDPVSICVKFDGRLSAGMNKWIRRYAQDSAATSICIYRGTTTQMIAAYLRLVVLSLAFQQQLKRGLNRDSYVVQKSIDAARSVIRIMIDKLYPTGTLRYAMEAHFLYVSFAAAFLLNFLRPKLLPLLDEGQYQGIVSLVGQLIDVLGSKEVALDGRHTPALYSRFLSSLLAKHRPKKSEATDTIMNDDLKIYPQYPSDRQQTPPNQFSWPDTTEYRGDVSPPSQSDLPDGTVFQQSGEATMDFSLTYFMRSVSQDQPAVGFDPNTRPVVAPMPVQWETYAQELSNLYNENASAQYATSWRPLF